MIIKELITYLSLLWKMVVLCLRFRTGTQILIYFPVLLQISSVTLSQLLWETHVKAPEWLMNTSPCSKRDIAADSQRDKHTGMMTVGRAIPKVSVQPHQVPLLSTSRLLCPRGDVWMPMENEQEMAWRGSAAVWPPVGTLEQAVLGTACFHGF